MTRRVPADRAWQFPHEGRSLAAIATRKVSPGRRSPSAVAPGPRSRRATPPHDSAFGFSPRDRPARAQRFSRTAGRPASSPTSRWLTMADSAGRSGWPGASPPAAPGGSPARPNTGGDRHAEGVAESPISFRRRVGFSKPTSYAPRRFDLRVLPSPPPGAGTALLADSVAFCLVADLTMATMAEGAARIARRVATGLPGQFARGARVLGGVSRQRKCPTSSTENVPPRSRADGEEGGREWSP